MKKFYLMAMIAALAVVGGCSTATDGYDAVNIAESELSIGLPIECSRTAIDDEGKASWCDGDTFALWAKNEYGVRSIDGAKFSLMYYWHSLQSAVFTSSEANSIADGTYTYYAVSPMPNSITGYKATYTLPAEQQGDSFNGAYDIMVATPLDAEAVVAGKVNNLALDFQHKMHTLKMTIPEGGNPFSTAISQVVFTFPVGVTGKVIVDATNKDNALTISETSNQLIVNISKGLNEEESAWATILPVNIVGEVSYYAVSAIGQHTRERKFSLSKECKEGHITPLSLTIPDPITIIRLSIGNNYLGEAVKNITIFDHNGTQIGSFAVNSSNTYDLIEYGAFNSGVFRTYSGKVFTVRFESQNAIVERKFTVPTINEYAVHTLPAIDVPYLFYDDFAGIGSFDKDDHDGDSLNSADGMLFSTSVSGWNGAHIKAVAGKCVRINVRHESTGGSTRSNGRLDTPAMKALKSGATVKLKVEFDMGSYILESGYNHNSELYCIMGTNTKSESSVLNGWAKRVVGGAPNNDLSRIPPMLEKHCHSTDHIAPNYGNNSFGDSFPTFSFMADNCTSTTRLTWVPGTNQNQCWLMGNVHYYLYIDNIRVSIAQ